MSKTKLLLDVVQDMRCLADSLQAMADAIVGNMDEEDTPVERATVTATAQPAAEKSAVSEKSAVPEKASAPEKPDTPKIDLVTLRAKVAAYSTPENRPKIKSILSALGVKKLTELTEEQYPVMLAEVEKACRT